MKRQKRIALINDISGFGRCSITVQLPLISAMKVQACPLPTAVLSVHTGFPDYFIDDYTDRMTQYIDSWKKNQLEFDGICTGFLGSSRQIQLVIDFIKAFKQEGTRVIIDPVMGDYGRLYASYTPEMCREMRRLLEYADVVTPNLTEACQLLDITYPQGGQASQEQLADMASQLAARGPAGVVITGLNYNGRIENFIYEKEQGCSSITVPKIGGDRSGTGDAFAAIVAAETIKGASLQESVQKASEFISRCLEFTEKIGLPNNHGLAFEEFLTELK